MVIPFHGDCFIHFFFYFQNNAIVTTEYSISSDTLPQSFNDYKIVQLSDLHSKSFGNDQSDLVNRVKKVSPNLIVCTGDLVDADRYDEEPSFLLMDKLVQIAPVYYVTGNHEWWSGEFNSLEDKLNDIGVHVMRNTAKIITNGTDNIHLVGIDDPAEVVNSDGERTILKENIEDAIEEVEKGNNFEILLSHRPEMFSIY